MKVSNLRYHTDESTFEPSAIVDVSVPILTLHEIRFMEKGIQDEIFLYIGKELFEQINALRAQNMPSELENDSMD